MRSKGFAARAAASIVVVLAVSVGLGSCGRGPVEATPRPTAGQSGPALAADACDAPAPTVEAVPGMPARPSRLLAGGVVRAGEFTFDMWLYCDPTLSPAGKGPSYSEIAGLGIHLVWRYTGPEIQGATDYSFGLGDLAIAGGGDGGPLTPGSMASYSGGVHSQGGALGKAVQSGNLVTITIKVQSGQVIRAADFSFAFQQGLSGLKLGSFVVQASP